MWPHPTPENHDFDKLEYILDVYEIVFSKVTSLWAVCMGGWEEKIF